ncbi:leucine-rich repeat protein [Porcipelethomonas sp.]|uniref:leucine-rich repeat protein n=1 Tax=Porcipelethomonas sp. TaxID=2981675 RepID=UPI003EF14027
MNILKKVLSVSTAFMCAACAFSGTQFMTVYGEENVYGNLKYNLLDVNSDGEGDYVEISGCTETVTEIEIPATIDGLQVITIAQRAFYNCSELESVTLPSCMSNIEKDAFTGTAFYENQTGIKYAGDWVLGCTSDLNEAVIKDGTKHIADYAFYKNESLKSITLPDSVKTIGNYAFLSCSGITNITIPESVYFLGTNAFADCASLSWIKFENPQCEINGNAVAISNGMDTSSDIWTYYFNGIIYGYTGSKAQEYAQNYDKKFVSLDADTIKGDANSDGTLNIRDAAFIAQKLAKGLVSELPLHADYNDDNTVNVRDAAAIARYMAEKFRK